MIPLEVQFRCRFHVDNCPPFSTFPVPCPNPVPHLAIPTCTAVMVPIVPSPGDTLCDIRRQLVASVVTGVRKSHAGEIWGPGKAIVRQPPHQSVLLDVLKRGTRKYTNVSRDRNYQVNKKTRTGNGLRGFEMGLTVTRNHHWVPQSEGPSYRQEFNWERVHRPSRTQEILYTKPTEFPADKLYPIQHRLSLKRLKVSPHCLIPLNFIPLRRPYPAP